MPGIEYSQMARFSGLWKHHSGHNLISYRQAFGKPNDVSDKPLSVAPNGCLLGQCLQSVTEQMTRRFLNSKQDRDLFTSSSM